METINIQAINDAAEKYKHQIATFLSDLVKIKSFSSDEKQVIDRIKQEMNDIGFDEVKVDKMGNLIGRIGNGETVIAMDGHVDVVDTGDIHNWDLEPFSGLIKDNKVWGRGTTDQKGGVASMIYAAKIMKELDLLDNVTIYMTATVNEENCDGLNWQYLYQEEKLRPEFVVITEPSNLHIMRGHRGRMMMKVTTKGVSAHGSNPEMGENAIYKMMPIIDELKQLNERLEGSNFLGRGSLTVSQIFFTSPSECAVPDECSIMIDRRITLGETKEYVVEQLQNLSSIQKEKAMVELTKYDEKSYTGLNYPIENYFPAWTIDEQHPAVKASSQAFKELFHKEPVIDKWVFSTNAVSICGMFNIPCIGFGPGKEEQAHTANEFIEIDQLQKAAMMYATIPIMYERLKWNK